VAHDLASKLLILSRWHVFCPTGPASADRHIRAAQRDRGASHSKAPIDKLLEIIMTDQNHTVDTVRLAIQARLGGGSDKIPNHSQKTVCVDTNAVLGKLSQSWQQRLDQVSADRGDETSAKTIKVDMESILSNIGKTRSTRTSVVRERRLSARAMVLATIALLIVLGLVSIV